MPDIDPAALSRPDSINTAFSASVSLHKVNGASALPSQKTIKTVNNTQRIDLEPLYANLKAMIGDNFGAYKDAIGLFVLGEICGLPNANQT